MSPVWTSRLSSLSVEVPLTDQPSHRAITLKACWCPAQFVQHSRRCVSTLAAGHPQHDSALSAGLIVAAADGHQHRFAEQQRATETTGAATAHSRRARRRCKSARAAGHPRHVSPLDAALFEGAADGRLERLVQDFLVKMAGRDWNAWSQNAGTALLCWVLRAPTLAIFGSLLALMSFRLSVLALAIVLQVRPCRQCSFIVSLLYCHALLCWLMRTPTLVFDAEGTHSPTGSFNS